MDTQVCTECYERKPSDDFYRDRAGIRTKCKNCARLARLDRRRANPAVVSTTHRKERYGLPDGEFERLLDLQDSKCGICGKTHKDCAKGLHLDHDHQTGAVRGLLCFSCNIHLGRYGARKGFEVESQNWLNRIVAG